MKKGVLSILLLFLSLFISFILSGCSEQTTETEQFDVEFTNVSHTDVFLSKENKTVDRLEFIMFNKEKFDLNCDIVIVLNNGTNSSVKKGALGIIGDGKKKNVSMSFEMLEGRSELRVEKSCEYKG